jgi:DNA polymerase-3 subunit delta
VVQVKAGEVDRFLRNPDPAIRVVLVYGPDDGLVSERSEAFARAVTGSSDDPFARLRFDAAAIAEDPARLADEAHAVPLFGGRRVITIRLSGNVRMEAAVEAILDNPPVDSWIVITAGDLRKTSPIRKLAEASRGAAAIPCYADEGRDLDRLIDEELKAAGLRIAGEARDLLRSLIGGDRLASRGEVQKLCLFAAGRDEISLDDVRAVIGDAAAFDVEEVIDAAALGDSAAVARTYRRLLASGTPGFVILGAAIRHFNFLHRARGARDRGESPDAIVGRAVPPIFYKRRATVIRQIDAWRPAAIERVMAGLDRAMIDSRLRGAIADDVVGQALLMVAAMASARRPAGTPAG